MTHRLVINNLGPIKNCDIDIKKLMIFTGPQSAGKSTVAKAVFFFRTIKQDIMNTQLKYQTVVGREKNLQKAISKAIRAKFLQIFGTSWTMHDMSMRYEFDKDVFVNVRLKENSGQGTHNYVDIMLSQKIIDWIRQWENDDRPATDTMQERRESIEMLLNDDLETVYIPAGRNLITLLTSQLNYIFAMMDDEQRRLLDYCTISYIELIMKLKPQFSEGIDGLLHAKKHLSANKLDKNDNKILKKLRECIEFILQGQYQYVDGEERLVIDGKKYIKINYASSGQQEVVWILNLIFYYLLEKKSVFFIFEEPESNLYPNAQRLITESIALAMNNKNIGIITTHSPYILGVLNNLLYGYKIYQKNKIEAEKILKDNKLIKEQLLDSETVAAYYVANGNLRNCEDKEINLIDNAVIDGASDDINELLNRWLELDIEDDEDVD